jgi:hypothetical protein
MEERERCYYFILSRTPHETEQKKHLSLSSIDVVKVTKELAVVISEMDGRISQMPLVSEWYVCMYVCICPGHHTRLRGVTMRYH